MILGNSWEEAHIMGLYSHSSKISVDMSMHRMKNNSKTLCHSTSILIIHLNESHYVDKHTICRCEEDVSQQLLFSESVPHRVHENL